MTTQALKDRLKKVEEGYEKQKREIRALCEYVNDLPHPVREEGPSFAPPTGVSIEVVGDIDRIKWIAQGAKVWVEGIQKEAFKHAEELVQVRSRALAALSRI